jgi:hypothetical protein
MRGLATAGIELAGIEEIAVIPGELGIHVGYEDLRQVALVQDRALLGAIAICDCGNHDAGSLIVTHVETPVLPLDYIALQAKSGSKRLLDPQRAGNLPGWTRRGGVIPREGIRHCGSAFIDYANHLLLVGVVDDRKAGDLAGPEAVHAPGVRASDMEDAAALLFRSAKVSRRHSETVDESEILNAPALERLDYGRVFPHFLAGVS